MKEILEIGLQFFFGAYLMKHVLGIIGDIFIPLLTFSVLYAKFTHERLPLITALLSLLI
jgi:hypothetical protein